MSLRSSSECVGGIGIEEVDSMILLNTVLLIFIAIVSFFPINCEKLKICVEDLSRERDHTDSGGAAAHTKEERDDDDDERNYY